jgi:putative transposase
MQFETAYLYHIYNQGNNRQKIFFSRRNYLFFIDKIKIHVVPFADILAWCLMPNHFHLMVHVNYTSLPTVGVTARKISAQGSHPDSTQRTFKDSIGIMLRSYTRSINNQQYRSGALFREETKAECLTRVDGITPAWYDTIGGTKINIKDPVKSYPQICFNYIVQNPLKAGIVKYPGDWEYSSFRETINKRNYTGIELINFERIREYGLEYSQGAT